MTRTYIRTETVTITKTEEVTVASKNDELGKKRLMEFTWNLIKKYVFSLGWIKGESDG